MKRTRTTAAVIAAIGLVTALTACSSGSTAGDTASGGTPVSGGTLNYAIDAQPTAGGVDPMVATALAAQTIMDQSYETLLTKNDDGDIEPGLATKYDEVDDTTYNFTLRKGVKFSDGSDFTAEDVVYTFETYQKSTTSKRAYLSKLSAVTAKSDHEVEFTLSAPDSTFLNGLSNRETFMVVSSDAYADASADDREKQTYGTGPFAVTDWKDGVSITLTKNKYYWGSKKPYLDEIVFQVIPDDSTRLAAVQQGSVQAAWFSDGTVADQAVSAGWTQGKTYDTQGLPIFINPESGPLSDVRVRRAVSLALDRDALVDTAMFGNGKVSYVTPAGDPSSPEVTKDTPYYTQNIKKAKALLKEAGQTSPTIELSYFGDAAASQHPIYELMQQQLAKAGITLKLESKSTSELAPIFTSGQSFTDMVSLPWSFRADPTYYFDPFLSEAGAENHWDGNADADEAKALLAQAKSETDPDAKAKLIQQLDDEVASQVLVLVPMSVPQHFEVWDSAKLKGYTTDPYGSRVALKDAWLEP
ncbi:ABC transporter substrate-binding protein [Curtobacterium pusillum]|uniref:ABC transporter substrate-binding protein n=1 Tax=Curtobacterium pusillum TaxID=69373 RepID=UPI00380816D8